MAKIAWLVKLLDDSEWMFVTKEPASWAYAVKQIVYFEVEAP